MACGFESAKRRTPGVPRDLNTPLGALACKPKRKDRQRHACSGNAPTPFATVGVDGAISRGCVPPLARGREAVMAASFPWAASLVSAGGSRAGSGGAASPPVGARGTRRRLQVLRDTGQPARGRARGTLDPARHSLDQGILERKGDIQPPSRCSPWHRKPEQLENQRQKALPDPGLSAAVKLDRCQISRTALESLAAALRGMPDAVYLPGHEIQRPADIRTGALRIRNSPPCARSGGATRQAPEQALS